MDYPVRVQIVKCVHELLGNLADLGLAQVAVVFENLEQLSLCKLSDHAKLVRRLEGVQQQDDVLVVQALQDFNLLPQVVHFLFRFSSKCESVSVSALIGRRGAEGPVRDAYRLVMNLRATIWPEPLRRPL